MQTFFEQNKKTGRGFVLLDGYQKLFPKNLQKQRKVIVACIVSGGFFNVKKY